MTGKVKRQLRRENYLRSSLLQAHSRRRFSSYDIKYFYEIKDNNMHYGNWPQAVAINDILKRSCLVD